MALPARGVSKILTICPETTYGVQGTTGAQQLPRVLADFNLNTSEILRPRMASGTLFGQLSPATYKMLFEGLLQGTWTAGASVTGATDGTATYDAANGILNVTATSTNFTTAGFKIGDIDRITGLTGGAAVDDQDNLRIISQTPNTLGLLCPAGATSAAWTTGQTEAFAVAGKKLIMLATGQVDRSFTIEQWFADIGVSEVFTGIKITQLSINIPASGFVAFQASFTRQNATTGNSQLYTGAAAPSGITSLTATGGRLLYGTSPIAIGTGMNLQIQIQADALARSLGTTSTALEQYSESAAQLGLTAEQTTQSLSRITQGPRRPDDVLAHFGSP